MGHDPLFCSHLDEGGNGIRFGGPEELHRLLAEAAAPDAPLVARVAEELRYAAQYGAVAGEDPHDVGAAPDLLVETFQGMGGADLAPVGLGEGQVGADSSSASRAHAAARGCLASMRAMALS